LKKKPTFSPTNSVTNYQPTPRNILEERRLQLHRGGGLKSVMTVADSKLGAALDFVNGGYKQIFERPTSFS
jgi:hypothetical protein